jgi:ElaB/YqjD/DUF883 family membrane-anchored ribosome-binding protein
MKYEQDTGRGESPTKRRRRNAVEPDADESRSRSAAKRGRNDERFSARGILDQLVERARGVGEGSSELVGNLGATVRDNPIPVGLMAVGIASLIASERMRDVARSKRATRGGLQDWDDDDLDRASAIKAKAREAAGELGERASALGVRAREKSSELGERMRGTMSDARERGMRTLQEEPLVLVGVGIAFGALLGAGFPLTQRERRTLGPVRERVLERAREVARDGAERVRESAERVREGAERVKSMAERATGGGIGADRDEDDEPDVDDDELDIDDAEIDDERMES